VVHTKIHQHTSRLLVQVAQDLLVEMAPGMVAAVVVALVVPVLHAEMELHQPQQHLQVELA
jgi:hypothetical protein